MKKKMSKFNGNEGWIVSKQSYDSLVKTHEDESGDKSDFTRHVTIGVNTFQKIMDTKPTAIKLVFGSDGHQKTVIAVPVDENGIELAVKSAAEGMKDGGGDGKGGTGNRCPQSC